MFQLIGKENCVSFFSFALEIKLWSHSSVHVVFYSVALGFVFITHQASGQFGMQGVGTGDQSIEFPVCRQLSLSFELQMPPRFIYCKVCGYFRTVGLNVAVQPLSDFFLKKSH